MGTKLLRAGGARQAPTCRAGAAPKNKKNKKTPKKHKNNPPKTPKRTKRRFFSPKNSAGEEAAASFLGKIKGNWGFRW